MAGVDMLMACGGGIPDGIERNLIRAIIAKR
jgi:hypothetical protein